MRASVIPPIITTLVTLEESNADALNVEDCWILRTNGSADWDHFTLLMD